MQEKKKRLCRFATETVLLLAEVTLNLALLDELEVLLCRGKKISITKFQVVPNVTELNPYETEFSMYPHGPGDRLLARKK